MTTYYLTKLSASNREAAIERITQRDNNEVTHELGPDVNVVIVGEGEGRDWKRWKEPFDAPTRRAFERGSLVIVPEVVYWYRSFFRSTNISTSKRLHYTSLDIANLSGESKRTIDALHRHGLFVPTEKDGHLFYFDIWHIQLLKIVRNLFDSGVSAKTVVEQMIKFSRQSYDIPLHFTVGKKVVSFTKSGNIDHNGQRFFSFDDDVV